MTLVLIIAIPLLGGIAAAMAGRYSNSAPRWIALGTLALDLVAIPLAWAHGMADGPWRAEFRVRWIPELGVTFHLGLDGLSLLLLLLSALLGIMATAASWREIDKKVGFFHFNLLWTIAGINGVFLTLDLFVFYFFWELMLVPMYFLIALWGHERRMYASVKFFIFTQLGGLLMIISILGLYFVHQRETGVYSFDYFDLLRTNPGTALSVWLLCGFLAAFLVKLPAFGVHTWLPDAHTEAPTAGSVILAGLLLKTGAYGLLRFALPLFPDAVPLVAPYAMAVAVAGIIYGSVLAFAQTDLKRLVAYTSIGHMGFVLLGAFALTPLALQGAVVQMLCHGLSTGALFIIAGAMQERFHTRDMRTMGGLWRGIPRMGGITMFFALASLGLPGMGNFVGEFLVLLGTYPRSHFAVALAAVGLVAAAVYALWMMQRTFFGPPASERPAADLSPREAAVLATLAALILWIGLYPGPVMKTAKPVLDGLAPQASAQTQAVNRQEGGMPHEGK